MEKGDSDLDDGTVRRKTNAFGRIYFESSGNTAKVCFNKSFTLKSCILIKKNVIKVCKNRPENRSGDFNEAVL